MSLPKGTSAGDLGSTPSRGDFFLFFISSADHISGIRFLGHTSPPFHQHKPCSNVPSFLAPLVLRCSAISFRTWCPWNSNLWGLLLISVMMICAVESLVSCQLPVPSRQHSRPGFSDVQFQICAGGPLLFNSGAANPVLVNLGSSWSSVGFLTRRCCRGRGPHPPLVPTGHFCPRQLGNLIYARSPGGLSFVMNADYLLGYGWLSASTLQCSANTCCTSRRRINGTIRSI